MSVEVVSSDPTEGGGGGILPVNGSYTNGPDPTAGGGGGIDGLIESTRIDPTGGGGGTSPFGSYTTGALLYKLACHCSCVGTVSYVILNEGALSRYDDIFLLLIFLPSINAGLL